MSKPKFPKQDLLDLLSDDETDDLVKIQDKMVEHSRWAVHHEMIFKQNSTGRFFKVWYSRGATESQDEYPFDYEPDEVEVQEVKPVEKTVIVYEAV